MSLICCSTVTLAANEKLNLHLTH